MKKRLMSISSLLLMLAMSSTWAADLTPLIQSQLPTLPESQETQLLEITLQPGEGTPIHKHNAYVYLYVLEGEVEMQIQGGELLRLTAGQTFTEDPDDIHIVSRNASASEQAQFLVFLIRTEGTPISIPVELN